MTKGTAHHRSKTINNRRNPVSPIRIRFVKLSSIKQFVYWVVIPFLKHLKYFWNFFIKWLFQILFNTYPSKNMFLDLWTCHFRVGFWKLRVVQTLSHFIFEINVVKSRIRHGTNLKLNDEFLDRLKIDRMIQIQNRSMSDPTLSNIDFKNKMAWVWTTLKSVPARSMATQP